MVEVLVSVALFSIVMVVALGALVSLSSAVKRAEALDTSTNNLAAALDAMSRAIRTGYVYHCGPGWTLPLSTQDCAGGDSRFTFQDGDNPSNQVTYCLVDATADAANCSGSTSCPSGDSCIVSRSKAGSAFVPLTSAEVNVSNLSFIVNGSAPGPGDLVQPKVTMLLVGTISLGGGVTSSFKLQTSISQHLYDQ